MPKEITIRKFLKEDLPKISDFRKSYFPIRPIRCQGPEYYAWKCYENPILPGEMWLAEDGQTLVGIKNVTPKKLKVQGDVIIGAEMGDSFTRPDYQRRGIFTALSKAARESILIKGVGLIYNTPGPNSLPGYQKNLDHALVPVDLRRLIKPLYCRQLLSAKFKSATLAAIPSTILGLISRAMLRFGTRGRGLSQVLISREETIPPDIDTLWDQASNDYDVILVRNKKYLDWRYIKNPDTYSFLVARDGDGSILGYLVTKLVVSGNDRIGFIVDFLTKQGGSDVFKRLLASALDECFRKKVDFVHAWGIKGSPFYKILVQCGFFRYRRVSLACYKNEIGAKLLNRKLKWHFTMGDADEI